MHAYVKLTFHKLYPEQHESSHPLWRNIGAICIRFNNISNQSMIRTLNWASNEFKDYRSYELIDRSCLRKILPKLKFDELGYSPWPENLRD